jgi:AbrB family looped-hinge helix DNA binding protein
MTVVKATVKGQILIPAPLRKKYKITRGTSLEIYEKQNKIVVEPVREEPDPVQAGMGLLKTKGRILKALLDERKKEAKV